jgi:DNA-binding CsgD family transcriptional regulator/tetratricopeptide (TPR) repeat protein
VSSSAKHVVAPPVRVPGHGDPLCPVLIGRDDLLALADRRLEAAADGHGELLFFAGEAGIGKTRLLREAAGRAAAAGFAVIGASAYPGDTETAAGLLTELAAELRRVPYTAAAGDRIAERLRDAGEGDAHRQRRLLVADLTELIEKVADCPWPMLVTLEDLHWADDLTLDVLGRLGMRARSLPVLFIGTYRSDELYPRVPMRAWRSRLLTQRHAEEARLGRLGAEDTAVMAAAIARADVPTSVTGAVFARSDGIPLHVEEFLATDGIPDTLADAVLSRAEQLSRPARALADAASVLGRSFDLDLLTALTGDDPESVDDGLRELVERFFVQPHTYRSVWDFRHALIRDALYADLTPHRRRDLHAHAAGAAVAAGFADAFVSDQYERAQCPVPAHRHALAAAADAVTMSAHREAVELYRRAQRTLASDAPLAARASLLRELAAELAATDDNQGAADAFQSAYEIFLELGDDLAAAAMVPGLVDVRHQLGASLDERTSMLRGALRLIAFRCDDAAQEVRANIHAGLSAAYMLDRRLAEAIEDGELAQSIAVEDCDRAMRCNLDTTLGSVLLFAGRMDEAWPLLEGAIERAAGWKFENQAARGYRMLGSAASVLVEYERAERWLREGIAYAERVERFNDRHYMTAHLAHVMWATGDWAGAEAEARHALADGRGGITTRITALHVLGFLALGRGQSATFLTEAASLGEGMRELQRISPAWWGLAETALRAGDFAAAVAGCEQGFAASARVRDAAYLFPYVVTGTRAQLALSGATAARDWLTRVEELLRERSIPGTLGALEHAAGLVHLHEGQTGKARVALANAAGFWASRRRFWEGTQALLDQARCATRSRRPGEAAVFAAQARAAASAVGAQFDFPSAPVPAPSSAVTGAGPDLPDGILTAREREIARVVALGMTNREIAAALTISPKTVAAHVEHILAKLGFARRAQIATWAATRH